MKYDIAVEMFQDFWCFIKQHLTKHEQERFNILKNIWTDVGKCRAWIRASLNERSLERYATICKTYMINYLDIIKK